jgi:hypothetical protein
MAVVAAALSSSGCYHFVFDQRPTPAAAPGQPSRPPSSEPDEVTHVERAATYLNGFIDTGRVESWKYCAHPLRTELRVTFIDVLLGTVTLLIYTPHTLYVVCPKSEDAPGHG